MEKEFKTRVDLGQGLFDVTVTYEMDGYKPLVYTIHDNNGVEITLDIDDATADAIYRDLCKAEQ